MPTMVQRLLASPSVVESVLLAGDVGVMALHGRLERRTELLAQVMASRTGASLYSVTLPPTLWWHVPSTRFGEDPSPGMAAFLGRVRTVVSIHGYGREGMEDIVLLGGRNRRLAATIAANLRRDGVLRAVDDLDAIPRGLRGLSPRNPVNAPPLAGVQVEVPTDARSGAAFDALVDAVAAGLTGGHGPGH